MQICGECTLCCYLFEIEFINKGSNTDCKYCDNGCTIYNNRPECCLGFNCAYLQMDNSDIRLRPDKCGVVFEKINEELFHGTQDPRVDISEDAKGQVMAFNDQGFTVVIKNKNKHSVLLAKGHNIDDTIKNLKKFSRNRHG